MSKNLTIEFDPTISKGLRLSAKYLGLKAEKLIILNTISFFRRVMETHPIYPLSEQLDPEGMENKTPPKRLLYILKLFVAWHKAMAGENGFEIRATRPQPKDMNRTILLCEYLAASPLTSQRAALTLTG